MRFLRKDRGEDVKWSLGIEIVHMILEETNVFTGSVDITSELRGIGALEEYRIPNSLDLFSSSRLPQVGHSRRRRTRHYCARLSGYFNNFYPKVFVILFFSRS